MNLCNKAKYKKSPRYLHYFTHHSTCGRSPEKTRMARNRLSFHANNNPILICYFHSLNSLSISVRINDLQTETMSSSPSISQTFGMPSDILSISDAEDLTGFITKVEDPIVTGVSFFIVKQNNKETQRIIIGNMKTPATIDEALELWFSVLILPITVVLRK